MAVEAPVSKFRKNNLIIWMIVCLGFATYCIYDGYFNDKFIKKHTDANGNPNSTLVFNQKSPIFLIAGAMLLGIYFFVMRNSKIIAEEDELVIPSTWFDFARHRLLRTGNAREKISYESIQKINKTYFDKKGFFTITYKNKNNSEVDIKISNRKYDNIEAILEHLVAKITGIEN